MISKNYKFAALMTAVIMCVTLAGCDRSPLVLYDGTYISIGLNPSLSGRIEGWSNESITASLTFSYTGDYDSAALFLDGTKVSNVVEFPFHTEYDITNLSSPATHVYKGKVWTQDTLLTASLQFDFTH